MKIILKLKFIIFYLGLGLMFTACSKDDNEPQTDPVMPDLRGEVTTITSIGLPYSDGTLATAGFDLELSGLAFDSQGNMYVGETRRIRKITPNGNVITVAGFSSSGSSDGTGTSARFYDIWDMVCDSNDNLFITDGNRIRKMTPSGVVTTLIENGVFNQITGITIDSNNNLYACDGNNNRIVKISPAGAVSTYSGVNGPGGYANGSSSDARYKRPLDIVFDKQGNLIVLDSENYRIRKINPQGFVTSLAGNGVSGYSDGENLDAQFGFMYSLCVDGNNNVIAAEEFPNYKIRKISSFGTTSTLAGSIGGFANGIGSAALFTKPRTLVYRNNKIFITDGSKIRVLE